MGENWHELQNRLIAKGYALRESGGGLILVKADDGTRICKASELGTSHARLAQRIGKALPGYAHSVTFERQVSS